MNICIKEWKLTISLVFSCFFSTLWSLCVGSLLRIRFRSVLLFNVYRYNVNVSLFTFSSGFVLGSCLFFLQGGLCVNTLLSFLFRFLFPGILSFGVNNTVVFRRMFTFSACWAWHVLFETGSALEHRQLIVQNIDLEIPVEFQIFVVSNHFTT